MSKRRRPPAGCAGTGDLAATNAAGIFHSNEQLMKEVHPNLAYPEPEPASA